MSGDFLFKVALLFVLGFVPSCTSRQANFPSDQLICLQKAGVAIAGFSSQDKSDIERLGDNHALYILNPRQLKFDQVLSYGRHLTIYWNRNETFLAIVDKEGSNRDVLYVYGIEQMSLRKIEILTPFKLTADDHYTIKCEHWNNDKTLSCLISCYGTRQYEKHINVKNPFDVSAN